MSSEAWEEPGEWPKMGREAVHVWRVSLEVDEELLAASVALLSADERTRAARYRFEGDRRHFVFSRAALRRILARYSGRSPAALRFVCNSWGKPALEAGGGSLKFNLSRSSGLALVAVARDRQVGVDVERVAEGIDIDDIAARFFSPGEAQALRSLPAGQRRAAFFNCWARKEAYLKARGTGIASSPSAAAFDVSLVPGEPARLLRTADPADLTRWSLRELDLGGAFAAAVAAEGHGWTLACRQWRDG